ncbi:phage protein [Escherichia coli]|nr:phage protein [Escherichia coli]
MRQECIQAVQQAAQRTLTAREIQNIEDAFIEICAPLLVMTRCRGDNFPNQNGCIVQHNWHLKNYSEKRH